jgi:formate dehydrogenase iron-sulfur subunit
MSEGHSDTSKMMGILTDVTKCIGCERCVEACSRQNKMPPEMPFHTSKGDGLSGRRLTAILKGPNGRTVRKQCLHCMEPSCASACLVGAFTKRPDGPVVYDASKCIGCRYCMLACPFMVPRYDWDNPTPYIRKCKMNEDCRVEGGMPACVSACPTGATIFGNRDDLIKEARRRIKDAPKAREEWQKQPAKKKGEEPPPQYIDHIWGEHEVGGTSVLYISDVPLSDLLRFPKDEELQKMDLSLLDTKSVPTLSRFWVELTPFWAGAIFTGLWGAWFIRRRQLLMSGHLPHDHGAGAAPSPGAAGIDEVCRLEPSDDNKEGK